MIALSVDGPKVVHDEVVAGGAVAMVLMIEAHGEDLEPVSFEVDTRDVLPRNDSNQILGVLDQAQHASLEPRAREVVHPPDRISVDPLFDVVLERGAGGAAEGCQARVIGSRVVLALGSPQRGERFLQPRTFGWRKDVRAPGNPFVWISLRIEGGPHPQCGGPARHLLDIDGDESVPPVGS